MFLPPLFTSRNVSICFIHICLFFFAHSLPQAYKTYSQLAQWGNEGYVNNSTLTANFAVTDSYIWCTRAFTPYFAFIVVFFFFETGCAAYLELGVLL